MLILDTFDTSRPIRSLYCSFNRIAAHYIVDVMGDELAALPSRDNWVIDSVNDCRRNEWDFLSYSPLDPGDYPGPICYESMDLESLWNSYSQTRCSSPVFFDLASSKHVVVPWLLAKKEELQAFCTCLAVAEKTPESFLPRIDILEFPQSPGLARASQIVVATHLDDAIPMSLEREEILREDCYSPPRPNPFWNRIEVHIIEIMRLKDSDSPYHPDETVAALYQRELERVDRALVWRGREIQALELERRVNTSSRRGVLHQEREYFECIRTQLLNCIDSPSGYWLGVIIENHVGKVTVRAIVENSPADTIGIRRDTAIHTLNGEQLRHTNDLFRIIGATPPNQPCTIEFTHKGECRQVEVQLDVRQVDDARIA